MKVKLDENIPTRCRAILLERGHDAVTVIDEGLAGSPDPVVAAAAEAEGRILFTLHREFGDLRKYRLGQHPGIVLFRLPDQQAPKVEDVLRSLLEQYDFGDIAGCLVIAEPGRLRFRRPESR
jgi:predicted nuclease of predicted toxin-antitoxin system